MEIVLTTNSFNPYRVFASGSASVLWKAWRESRGRFFSALVLLASLVVYAVLTSPGFLDRYNTRFPDNTLLYSVLGAPNETLEACVLERHLTRFFGVSVLKGTTLSSERSAQLQLESLEAALLIHREKGGHSWRNSHPISA